MKYYLDGDRWKVEYFRSKNQDERSCDPYYHTIMRDGLDAGVQLPDFDDKAWYDASVPCDVRDVMMKNEVISDPYQGRNSDASAWVTDFEWWYRKYFELPEDCIGQNIRLVFKGVDLFADYYLNGEYLGSSNDMFISTVFDISGKVITNGRNTIAVRLHPQPSNREIEISGCKTYSRVLYHKAQLSWGWDWTRDMVSMGIWDSVYLDVTDKAAIKDLFIQAQPSGGTNTRVELKLNSDYDADTDTDIGTNAQLELKFGTNTDADVQMDLELEAYVEVQAELVVRIIDEDNSRIMYSYISEVSLKKGMNLNKFEFKLHDIELWYPNGYGSQKLYKAEAELKSSGVILASECKTFGVRKIEMLRNDNSPESAYNLTFCVNGMKIFAFGGNWVPVDLLFARITPEKYDLFVKKAADIGFNMFRIWGGGLIEKDSFYNCCDKYGILVWQEFPLSCAKYPEDEQYVKEMEYEADFIIKKLRSHPSIALYCGGNEMFYYGETSNNPVLQMFKKRVAELHPAIDYHFASPDKEREGERDHGPWSYFDKQHAFWNNHFRCFSSEVGCCASISYKNLARFLSESDIKNHTQALRHHFINLDEYDPELVHCYNGVKLFDCKSDEEIIFVSQFIQADSLSYLTGKYRSCAWRSSGVLFWQYNSSWPEGMFALIDYYGDQKLACYFLKGVCGRNAIHIEDEDFELLGADILKIRVKLLGDYFQQNNLQIINLRIASKKETVFTNSVTISSGEELEIELKKIIHDIEESFFRLDISITLPDGQLISRFQYYAIDRWKQIKVCDLMDEIACRFPDYIF